MTIGIYSISDSETGEILYVGQSSNIEERWKHHLKRLRADKHLKNFSEWFTSKEKDETSLKFEILEECDNSDECKNLLEIKWFTKLSPRFYGTIPSENNKWGHSTETRESISKSLRGRRPESSILNLEQKCRSCGKMFKTKAISKFCSRKCSSDSQKIVVNLKYVEDEYRSGRTMKSLCDELQVSLGYLHKVMKKDRKSVV